MSITNTIRWLVVVHFISHIIHLSAHFYHGVPTVFITNLFGKMLGYLFILIFFILLPIGGWWQLRGQPTRQGYLLLAVAMAPSWLYAFLYHFVLNTSDYVCLFGATVTARWFSWSAYTISFVDAALFILSAYALTQLSYPATKQ